MDEVKNTQFKIFIINLESQVNRKNSISNQLIERNLDFEIFPAVNGKDLKEETILEYYTKEFYDNRHHSYPIGMIGCSISHFLLYKKIVKDKIPYSIIMEDDILLGKDFNNFFLEKIKFYLHKEKIILLFYQNLNKIILSNDFKQDLEGTSYSLFSQNNLKGFVSTGCYIISYETAKNMYEQMLPINTYPDEWSTFYERNYFRKLEIVYPFIIESALYQSSISNIVLKNKLLNFIFSRAQKHNILFFNNILKIRRKYLFDKTRQKNFK